MSGELQDVPQQNIDVEAQLTRLKQECDSYDQNTGRHDSGRAGSPDPKIQNYVGAADTGHTITYGDSTFMTADNTMSHTTFDATAYDAGDQDNDEYCSGDELDYWYNNVDKDEMLRYLRDHRSIAFRRSKPRDDDILDKLAELCAAESLAVLDQDYTKYSLEVWYDEQSKQEIVAYLRNNGMKFRRKNPRDRECINELYRRTNNSYFEFVRLRDDIMSSKKPTSALENIPIPSGNFYPPDRLRKYFRYKDHLEKDYAIWLPKDGKQTKTHDGIKDRNGSINKRVKIQSLGRRTDNADVKSVLILGGTGVGKSTLVNSLVNYLYGVKFEDQYRLKIIDDSGATKKYQSQTKDVTAYSLRDTVLDYSIRLIDTPGFGDTDGPEADKRTLRNISALFRSKKVHELHAIVVVLKATETRLTAQQRFILANIYSLFSQDCKPNIIFMATFADGAEPPVKEVLRGEDTVDFKLSNFLKINNSGVFDNDVGSGMAKIYWDICRMGFDALFNFIGPLTPIGVENCVKVLDMREDIENQLDIYMNKHREGIAQISQIQADYQALAQHQAQVEQGKHFEVEQRVQVNGVVETAPPGRNLTNCMVCNNTCHPNCIYANDEDKRACSVMDENGNCQICPNKCNWAMHKNTPEIWGLIEQVKFVTSDELKNKYESGNQGVIKYEDMIRKASNQLGGIYEECFQATQNISANLDKLSKIALNPRGASSVEYLEMIIQAEKRDARNGWRQRVTYFEADLHRSRQAELMRSNNIANFDPFQEQKATSDGWYTYAKKSYASVCRWFVKK